jgi:farnesyl-diphosphate farnesyltransferase
MNQPKLDKSERQYLSNQLEKVSRSFALVIPTLEEPLNFYVATAYLICRVVDNIEDCTQSAAWKEQRFQEFQQLVTEPTDAQAILERWSQEQWPGLTQDEKKTMGVAGGKSLWEIFAKIPGREQAGIRRWASEMATGMARFEAPQAAMQQAHAGIRVLGTESNYNDYCFYVAGTVGHMATELAVSHYGLSGEAAIKLNATCEACGRGLQKTNIVKDFASDLARGNSYIPYSWHQEIDFSALSLAGAPIEWTRKVLGDVVRELQDATEYVLSLPYSAAGYRMACLMSLLPAYETLHLAARKQAMLFTPEHQVKISRPTMAKCKWKAKSMLRDNDAVIRYSDRMAREIDLALVRQSAAPDPSPFR